MEKNEKTAPVLRLIKETLEKREYSRKNLANALEKSEGWLSQIMSGEITLTVETLLDIAKILGVEVSSLLPGSKILPGLTFEEYIRKVVQEEMGKVEVEKK